MPTGPKEGMNGQGRRASSQEAMCRSSTRRVQWLGWHRRRRRVGTAMCRWTSAKAAVGVWEPVQGGRASSISTARSLGRRWGMPVCLLFACPPSYLLPCHYGKSADYNRVCNSNIWRRRNYRLEHRQRHLLVSPLPTLPTSQTRKMYFFNTGTKETRDGRRRRSYHPLHSYVSFSERKGGLSLGKMCLPHVTHTHTHTCCYFFRSLRYRRHEGSSGQCRTKRIE